MEIFYRLIGKKSALKNKGRFRHIFHVPNKTLVQRQTVLSENGFLSLQCWNKARGTYPLWGCYITYKRLTRLLFLSHSRYPFLGHLHVCIESWWPLKPCLCRDIADLSKQAFGTSTYKVLKPYSICSSSFSLLFPTAKYF